MRVNSVFLIVGVVGAFLLVLAGCVNQDVKQQPGEPPFGSQREVARAQALWNKMGDYTSWKPYPGMAGWQDGKNPHAPHLKYYVNDVAHSNPTTHGAIIVKENYKARTDDALAAVTVMQKIRGYDPDNADWFWVKFGPKGEILKNPKGMSLAGRVAKGMPKGCISCHGNAGGNDYLFANDE